ncbi:MAG: hypothetical protein ACK4FA_00390 [Candidatus Paceibacteria bacterium]
MRFIEKAIEKRKKKETNEVFERRCTMLEGLLRGYFDTIDTDNRPTALDFDGLNPNATEEDFLAWIGKTLNISPDKIKNNDSQTYKNLNQALFLGKDFLRQMLKYSDRELAFGPTEFKNKKDIFELLNGTKMSKDISDKNGGLDTSVAYCRIVKATHVAYEVLKNDAQLLRELTERFSEHMTSDAGENAYAPLTVKERVVGPQEFYVEDENFISGKLEIRSKDLWKLMLRFINRPESNAKKALEDGVAARIIISKEHAIDLLPILSSWLLESMRARNLSMENKNFFSAEESLIVKDSIRKVSTDQNFTIIDSPVSNQVSSGSFAGLVIKGRFPNRSLVSSDTSKNVRQFEIMIVTPDNENDNAHSPGNHHIYDMKKVVAARTRLDGYCTAEVFENLLNETSTETGIDKEEIRKWLLEPLEGKDSPIKEVVKHNKRVYVSKSVIERWHGFGFVEDYVFEQI